MTHRLLQFPWLVVLFPFAVACGSDDTRTGGIGGTLTLAGGSASKASNEGHLASAAVGAQDPLLVAATRAFLECASVGHSPGLAAHLRTSRVTR
jgi:hypothetical protein